MLVRRNKAECVKILVENSVFLRFGEGGWWRCLRSSSEYFGGGVLCALGVLFLPEQCGGQ